MCRIFTFKSVNFSVARVPPGKREKFHFRAILIKFGKIMINNEIESEPTLLFIFDNNIYFSLIDLATRSLI